MFSSWTGYGGHNFYEEIRISILSNSICRLFQILLYLPEPLRREKFQSVPCSMQILLNQALINAKILFLRDTQRLFFLSTTGKQILSSNRFEMSQFDNVTRRHVTCPPSLISTGNLDRPWELIVFLISSSTLSDVLDTYCKTFISVISCALTQIYSLEIRIELKYKSS